MLERIVTSLHFHELSLLAVIDILFLALIIYQLLLMIRGTRAMNVLLALVALIFCYVLTGRLLELRALHAVLGSLLIYVPFAVIVLFQNQIRRALANLGKNPLSVFLPRRVDKNILDELSLAAASLASKRLGALIVIERGIGLRTFSETGIRLDALVSYDLLMNIFTRQSPLHDGAVILVDGRIRAASCYLPLTTNPSLSRMYGTRHRAAIGVTEETDALCIVVSEERGELALAEGGKLTPIADARTLKRALEKALSPAEAPREKAAGAKLVAEGSGDA